MEAGPGAPCTDPVPDAQGAGVDEGVRFDVDVEASRRRFYDDARIASPSRRCATESLERFAERLDELRSDIEQRRQREVTFLELAMRDAETGRLVWAALVPKQVEIDAPRTPALVGVAAAAETTFGTQQHRQKLGR